MDEQQRTLLRIAIALETMNEAFDRLNREGLVVFAGKTMEEN